MWQVKEYYPIHVKYSDLTGMESKDSIKTDQDTESGKEVAFTSQSELVKSSGNDTFVIYTVEETPPWPLCIFLGFQASISLASSLLWNKECL